MGEALVDRALARLPRVRARRPPGRSRTFERCRSGRAAEPLAELAAALGARFGLDPRVADQLARRSAAPTPRRSSRRRRPAEHRPIGDSRHCAAELRFAWRRECATSLCDLLERRTRLALLAAGQGLPELGALAAVAAEEAGWDEARSAEEIARYTASVRRHYQIADPRLARRAA